MEKRRPTYDLDGVKRSIESADDLAITSSATASAFALGFSLDNVVETVATIERRMFVKSMTTYVDPRLWQDVYHVPARGLLLYVKFQADVIAEFKIMSFKEK